MCHISTDLAPATDGELPELVLQLGAWRVAALEIAEGLVLLVHQLAVAVVEAEHVPVADRVLQR